MTILPAGHIAPISRRAVAYILDAVISAGIGIVLGGAVIAVALSSGSAEGILTTLTIGMPVVSLVLLAWAIVYTLMQAGAGSIGMRAQGVRLVDAQSGESIGFGRALLRNIVFGLAGTIVVGYFSPLFDGSGRFQGWHDKAARSIVVDARAPRAGAAAPATTAIPHVPARPAPGLATPGQVLGAPAGYTPSTPVAQPPLPSALPVVPGYPAGPPTGAAAAPVAPPAPAAAYPVAPAHPTSSIPGAAAASAEIDETVVAPRPATPPAVVEPESVIAFVPGVTLDGPPAPAAAPALPAVPPAPAVPSAPAVSPAPAPSPVAEPPSISAEALAEEGDIEQTRISVPGHRLVLIWDDGTRVSVSRRTLFGRNPAPEEGAVTVSVRDETLSLSKTHFEVAAEATGGWIVDRGSTNGTTIVRDGASVPCPAGQKVAIRLGDVISIGDRIVTVGGYE